MAAIPSLVIACDISVVAHSGVERMSVFIVEIFELRSIRVSAAFLFARGVRLTNGF